MRTKTRIRDEQHIHQVVLNLNVRQSGKLIFFLHTAATPFTHDMTTHTPYPAVFLSMLFHDFHWHESRQRCIQITKQGSVQTAESIHGKMDGRPPVCTGSHGLIFFYTVFNKNLTNANDNFKNVVYLKNTHLTFVGVSVTSSLIPTKYN